MSFSSEQQFEWSTGLTTVDENKSSVIECSSSRIEKSNDENSSNKDFSLHTDEDSGTEGPSAVETSTVVDENEDAASFQAESSTIADNTENDTVVEPPVVENGAFATMFPFSPIEFPKSTPLIDQYVRDLTSLLYQ
ncbi:24363_t:CDS:2 [Gigaspora margarita]|uniref:24363_t:CDS:1 n=1 Tax=Gigaspora margarita TaxID=4874 RepID=A0ABN7VCH9_GIGMA|nr:24363_t:CDS:2 [Gigaspora margarita]